MDRSELSKPTCQQASPQTPTESVTKELSTVLGSDAVRERFQDWYNSLELTRSGFPARGTIAGALVVLDRLQEDFTLDIDKHTARGGSQIIGTSGKAVQSILAKFGETRPFLSEGGRTNRGLRGDIQSLLSHLDEPTFTAMDSEARRVILSEFQQVLVQRVQDWHNRQRIKVTFSSHKSTRTLIKEILQIARNEGKAGPVAQYLVGAKLQRRLSDKGIVVSNESFSTADTQLGRQGDFLIGNTVFHVTVAPQVAVYEKCARNIQDGYRPYLLVEDDTVFGARQNAEQAAPGQITVESIESFVGQNIDEMAGFTNDTRRKELFSLLQTYNHRVDLVENDKSVLIEIPHNLESDA
ncbi:MAG: DUF4928 domain-containing protein [Chloroflexi bacterium]|jgi:hypothetical protein|nr:DUF4928 domain-containing protein [Chloroflexota bacterium]MDL1916570.1 DUF4928 domain-containing protein [Anaerolineae bacterium CFX4]